MLRPGILTALAVVLLALAAPAGAATLTVDATTDLSDAAPGDGACAVSGGGCTLRAAIEEANALAGADLVGFSLPAGSTVVTAGDLAVTAPLTIDGCGAAGGEDPCVGVRASGGAAVLSVQASGSSVTGLAVSSSAAVADGIRVPAAGTSFALRRSWIGLGLDGLPGQFTTGVRIQADGAAIGGTTPAERTVFANSGTGLVIEGGDGAVVRGSYFGTNKDGTAADQNGNAVAGNGTNIVVGRLAGDPATDTTIGGTLGPAAEASDACDGACNVISRGTAGGITLQPASGPAGPATIAGNHIGLDASGAAALPNANTSVFVGTAPDATVGGPTAADGNRLAGGAAAVIGVYQTGTAGVTVRHNVIGMRAAGTVKAAFVNGGITVAGSSAKPAIVRDNRVVSASSTGSAVELGGIGAQFRGNVVGMLDDGGDGVSGGGLRITGNQSLVGGSAPGDANTFAYVGRNLGLHAIYVDGGDANVIVGNRFGVDAGGTPRPIHGAVMIRYNNGAALDNVVGGDTAAEENLIANTAEAPAAAGDAILIHDPTGGARSTGNLVLRNRFSAIRGQLVDVAATNGSFLGDGPGNPDLADGGVSVPSFSEATTLGASGTADPGATVRVFVTSAADGADPGDASAFAGSAVADGAGSWTIVFAQPLPDGARVTAAATRVAGGSVPASDAGTSEFALARLTLDATPAETVIDGGPSGTVAPAAGTFTFSSEPGATFECRIDGAPFAPCTSPFGFGVLTDGSHTFEVRASDTHGNTDPTPASRTFTVATPVPPAGPPAGPPLEADTSAPNVTLPTGRRTLSRKRVLSLRITCPASERSGPCRGSLTLRTAAKVRTGKRRAPAILTLGRATFTAAPGATATARITLSKAAFALVGAKGLRTRLTAAVSDAAGNRATATSNLTIVGRRPGR